METPPVRFTTAADGTRIAYIVWPGESPAWLQVHSPGGTPIALQAKMPGMCESSSRLAGERTRVWFDWRGSGQSERRMPSCLDDLLLDLSAVTTAIGDLPDVTAPNAACLEACTFVARNPGAWRSLILSDPMVRLPGSPQGTIIRPGWEEDYEGFVQSMARNFFPWLRGPEFQSVVQEWAATVPPEAHRAFRSIDTGLDLAMTLPHVRIPILVLKLFPRSEAAAVAALLPDAVLVERVMGNLGARARADWDRHIGSRFSDPIGKQPATATAVELTVRESQVLARVAAGDSNLQIASSLSLSTRTVERHVQNIYTKLNVHNRVEAANWARDHGVV